MFTRVVQPGLLCLFDADSDNPLKLWDKKIRNGQIKRMASDEIKGLVLEMTSKMPFTNYIHCPASLKQNLGIHYPFFNMIVKLSFSTFFAFDVQVLDDREIKRRFRASTIQTYVDVQPFMCKLPLAMESGWNHIIMPLHFFVKNVYGTGYVQTLRIALYPNCLVKKIYFTDREYASEDVPHEFHVEEMDLAESYRLKYASAINQKKKSSLSYYSDIINEKNGKAGSMSAAAVVKKYSQI